MKIKIKVTKHKLYLKNCVQIEILLCKREHVNDIQKLQLSSLLRDVLKRQSILQWMFMRLSNLSLLSLLAKNTFLKDLILTLLGLIFRRI
jgi:hypothetical protein